MWIHKIVRETQEILEKYSQLKAVACKTEISNCFMRAQF